MENDVMSVPLLRLFLVLSINLLSIWSVWSEQHKFAFVVGNADYSGSTLGDIPNARIEQLAVAIALAKYHFKVTHVYDANYGVFKETLAAFGQKIQDADVALFYYTGHGDLVQDDNSLLPVGVMTFPRGDVPISEIERTFKNANVKVGIIVIDACRGKADVDASQAKGAPAGLPRTKPKTWIRQSPRGPNRTIVKIFSTERGESASPGDPQNLGPFAQAFVDQISTPNATLYDVTARITRQVIDVTGGKQTPFWEPPGDLGDGIYFNKKDMSEPRQ
jgi:uncharacterized caspase-like protein